MLQQKESRANAQSTDDNGDATHAPSSCTTHPNDDVDSLSDTAHDDGDSISADTAHMWMITVKKKYQIFQFLNWILMLNFN
eukprot:scaffold246347_cov47-Attheya_sp.AAC.2